MNNPRRTFKTAWVVVLPSGQACALFATQALADDWITANPVSLAGAVSEAWAVHTQPLTAVIPPFATQARQALTKDQDTP